MARTLYDDACGAHPETPSLNRRGFAATALGGALCAASATSAPAETAAPAQPLPRPRMLQNAPTKPLTVAMLVYPGMIALDLIGPQTIMKKS